MKTLSPKTTVIPARRIDCPQVYQVEREAFGDEPLPQFYFYQARQLFGNGFRVALVDNLVAGYIIVAPDARLKEIGHIVSMATTPAFRNQGIGRKLLMSGLKHLRKMGISCARLSVVPENQSAIDLYTSAGFTKIRYSEFYFGAKGARNIMEKYI